MTGASFAKNATVTKPKMKLIPIGTNQTEVHFNERLSDKAKHAVFFFSYSTPVAAKVGTIYYRCEDKYSQTTTRHTNAWLEGVESKVQPQSWFEKAILEVHPLIFA